MPNPLAKALELAGANAKLAAEELDEQRGKLNELLAGQRRTNATLDQIRQLLVDLTEAHSEQRQRFGQSLDDRQHEIRALGVRLARLEGNGAAPAE